MEYICVECGFEMGEKKALFIQYSPGNIRLIKCLKCKLVADQYIECDFMILFLDLILHKPKAYRHLLHNLLNQQLVYNQGLFWKSALAYILLDGCILFKIDLFLLNRPNNYDSCTMFLNVSTYDIWLALSFSDRIMISNWSEENWNMEMNFSSLFWRCGKMLTDLLLGNFMFLCSLVFLSRFFCDPTMGVSRFKGILLAIFISSYFKIFLIAMAVWEFPSSVILITDIFVLSSNTVALKVMTEASIDKCIGACLSAHTVKFLIRWLLNIITNPSSLYSLNVCWKNLVKWENQLS